MCLQGTNFPRRFAAGFLFDTSKKGHTILRQTHMVGGITIWVCRFLRALRLFCVFEGTPKGKASFWGFSNKDIPM